jgi:eukaryotic-like serine/threonine-protein kinase
MIPRGIDSLKLGNLCGPQAAQVLDVLSQYMEELDRGLDPDAAKLLAGHPELAEVLKPYLEELDLLHHAAEAGVGASAWRDDDVEDSGEQGRLGDFRLLREVGRGGMGVVYEAEQMSLNRRVALKVLPFAGTLDARHLQRFKNEARAAAHLHHPHIVPVYGVGTDKGVHYYAMQFIEGQNLADIVQQMRAGAGPSRSTDADAATLPQARLSTLRSLDQQAFFRTVAEIGMQAALALEYAHQLGIVHRDIKPANLLLDEMAHLWITDFGLARCLADPGLTASGDMFGTLRYMSPEQACAKRALADHRSDIYSLGVTLYEVLTLQPVYLASDREELLRQIVWDDPPPPRQLNPAIPLELDTIVLKAMARDPKRRYHTAQELADDLRRLLEHRPILATRPTVREHALKWAQRHKSIVGACAVVLFLALAGLSAATLLIWHEKGQTEQALIMAQSQSRRAKANFDKALQGSMRLMMRLEDKRWASIQPVIKDLHRDVVDETLKFYREFLHEDSPDPADRYETARLYRQIAGIYCFREEHTQSMDFLGRSVRLFEGLLDSDPQNVDYQMHLAEAHYSMAYQYAIQKRRHEAHDEYARVAEHYRHAARYATDSHPANHLAWFLANCPDRDIADAREAVALAHGLVEREPQMGVFWNTLGVAYYRAGDWRAAIESLKKSMALRSGGDGYDWFFMAMAHWQLGEKQLARQWYERGVKSMEKMRPEQYELPEFKAEAEAQLEIARKT